MTVEIDHDQLRPLAQSNTLKYLQSSEFYGAGLFPGHRPLNKVSLSGHLSLNIITGNKIFIPVSLHGITTEPEMQMHMVFDLFLSTYVPRTIKILQSFIHVSYKSLFKFQPLSNLVDVFQKQSCFSRSVGNFWNTLS